MAHHRNGSEGARLLKRFSAQVPPETFFWAGLVAVAASAGLLVAGRKQASAVFAAWAPALLGVGFYMKLTRIGSTDWKAHLH